MDEPCIYEINEQEWVTSTDAADYLDVHRNTVNNAVFYHRSIRSLKAGQTLFVLWEDVKTEKTRRTKPQAQPATDRP